MTQPVKAPPESSMPTLYEEPNGQKFRSNIFITRELARALDVAEATIRDWTWQEGLGSRWPISKSHIIEQATRLALEQMDSQGEESELARRIMKDRRENLPPTKQP